MKKHNASFLNALQTITGTSSEMRCTWIIAISLNNAITSSFHPSDQHQLAGAYVRYQCLGATKRAISQWQPQVQQSRFHRTVNDTIQQHARGLEAIWDWLAEIEPFHTALKPTAPEGRSRVMATSSSAGEHATPASDRAASPSPSPHHTVPHERRAPAEVRLQTVSRTASKTFRTPIPLRHSTSQCFMAFWTDASLTSSAAMQWVIDQLPRIFTPDSRLTAAQRWTQAPCQCRPDRR